MVAVISLVLDNLSIHTLNALYKTFAPTVAHSTLWWLKVPTVVEVSLHAQQGSWLTTAEIELSILTRKYLSRRIPTPMVVAPEFTAYERRRNRSVELIRW